MATRLDILENYFTNGQRNSFVFKQLKAWTQVGSISGPVVYIIYKIAAFIYTEVAVISKTTFHDKFLFCFCLVYTIYQKVSFLGLKAQNILET